MVGISNHTFLDFIEKKTSVDAKTTMLVFFHPIMLQDFVNFHNMMTETGARYPFIIMNTDRCDKKGTYW